MASRGTIQKGESSSTAASRKSRARTTVKSKKGKERAADMTEMSQLPGTFVPVKASQTKLQTVNKAEESDPEPMEDVTMTEREDSASLDGQQDHGDDVEDNIAQTEALLKSYEIVEADDEKERVETEEKDVGKRLLLKKNRQKTIPPSARSEIEKKTPELSREAQEQPEAAPECQTMTEIPESKIEASEPTQKTLTVADMADVQETIKILYEEREYMDKVYRELNDRTTREANDREAQINGLLNQLDKYLKDLEKEDAKRKEMELYFTSRLAEESGKFQREKEKSLGFLKAMAEMRSADGYKMDNSHFTNSIKSLRLEIRNWARNVRVKLPSNSIMSFTRFTGTVPSYEFLRDVTPLWSEYTNEADFSVLLQAYLWRRLAELIFDEDGWAGDRTQVVPEETDYRLPQAFRVVKRRLEPDETTPKVYTADYHEWRAISARLMAKRIPKPRLKISMINVREKIIEPFLKAAHGHPEEQDLEVEDLDAIIDKAVVLSCTIAQQRADIKFEFFPSDECGRVHFDSRCMSDSWDQEALDPNTQIRVVALTLAPGLLKFGTSEGTNFESCTRLLNLDVLTKVTRKPQFRNYGQ